MSSHHIKSIRDIGIAVLVFVVLFFLILPFYLGPNDLQACSQSPENSHPKPACHQADAIVAVSGGDTPARVGEAIRLYQKGWAPYLVFSGAALDKEGPSNAQIMKSQAIKNGVPEENILIEEASANTQENARNTQNLLADNKFRHIILVTSAYHQRRASLEFDTRAANNGQAIFVVNHPVSYDKQWGEQWYLTPSGWWLALSELVKIMTFYITGK